MLTEHYPGALAVGTGAVLVNEYLQVEGLWNVLAVGDCTDAAGEKNALSVHYLRTAAAAAPRSTRLAVMWTNRV